MRPVTCSFKFQVSSFKLLGTALLLAAIASSAATIQTQVVKSDTYDEFAPGEFHSVTLSHLGRLTLAPELKRLYRADAEILWSLAAAPDGRVFLGSGHAGKVFVIDRKSSGTLLVRFHAPEVTALLFHSDGKLYAGTSPDGKLWVCDKPGTATLVYATGEKYVWDLIADPQGNIIVATGPKGRIFKVDPAKKKGELLFKAPDDNVLSLAYDPKGRLHASTQGKGRVYRWDQDRPTTPVVLFEAPDDEIRRIAIDPSGNVFAAANSEIVARRLSSSIAQLMSAMAASAAARPPEGPSGGEGPKPPSPPPSGPPSAPTPTGRSEIYMIDSEGFAHSLWRVSEAPVHSMTYDAERKSVLIGAGSKGKLFRVDTRANYWVVMSVGEEQILALKPAAKQIYLATAGPTVAYALGANLARKGEYISSAVNAGSTVRWGGLRREGTDIDNIEIETRSGNAKEPDGTWYNWQPIKWDDAPRSGKIQSPVARYLQWRALLKAGRGGTSPELDMVEFFYAPSNEGPQIKKIEIKKSGAPSGPPRPPETSGLPPSLAAAMASASAAAGGAGPREPSAGKEFNVADNSNGKKFEITWTVNDPNGDPLESALYFKAEDEKTWMLIEEKLTQNKFTFDTSSLANGVYRIKVVVSDRPANYAPVVKTDEMVSNQFVVDNTSPEIEKIKVTPVREAKGKWHVSTRATDALSLIVSAKYNIDGGKWQVLIPTDGIFDDRTESFEFDTSELKGDEHVLGLIVTDREGNSAVGKAFLRP